MIIRELLGYESIKTTEIYTHVSKTDIEKLSNLVNKQNVIRY